MEKFQPEFERFEDVSNVLSWDREDKNNEDGQNLKLKWFVSL